MVPAAYCVSKPLLCSYLVESAIGRTHVSELGRSLDLRQPEPLALFMERIKPLGNVWRSLINAVLLVTFANLLPEIDAVMNFSCSTQPISSLVLSRAL
jgi:hypothetical protein